MKETPFYFENDNEPVFGILHEPDEIQSSTGFVFCYPFLEEKLWAQRVFVNFARELALRGYPVLRFDYRGHGDSGGNFEDFDIETRLSDIKVAISTLKEKISGVKTIGLLGLRFGATLAAITAENEADINPLILWEPIVNGEEYMQELLRINLTTQTAVYKEIRFNREKLVEQLYEGETINIDGYEIKQNFYDQVAEINLMQQNINYKNNCLIIQITRKPERTNKQLDELQNKYKKATFRSVNEFPFWKEIKIFYSKAENLFKTTLDWINDEKF